MVDFVHAFVWLVKDVQGGSISMPSSDYHYSNTKLLRTSVQPRTKGVTLNLR